MEVKNNNVEKMNNILHISLEQIAKISILLNPMIPNASTKVLDALNITNKNRNHDFLDGNILIPNEVQINELNILFNKIN